MVIDDGILTPSISVLFAASGLKEATDAISEATEAMFADLGHFPIKFIQISMGCVVYPAQVTTFSGHASWLRKNMNQVANTFYKSDPDALYMPVFVVVVMVAIIAIQAMIYGTFLIIKQSLYLGSFPRVQVLHTSTKYYGNSNKNTTDHKKIIHFRYVNLSFILS
ncbi:hypothetical protein R6Q59_019207 [Mikania micrantha]